MQGCFFSSYAASKCGGQRKGLRQQNAMIKWKATSPGQHVTPVTTDQLALCPLISSESGSTKPCVPAVRTKESKRQDVSLFNTSGRMYRKHPEIHDLEVACQNQRQFSQASGARRNQWIWLCWGCLEECCKKPFHHIQNATPQPTESWPAWGIVLLFYAAAQAFFLHASWERSTRCRERVSTMKHPRIGKSAVFIPHKWSEHICRMVSKRAHYINWPLYHLLLPTCVQNGCGPCHFWVLKLKKEQKVFASDRHCKVSPIFAFCFPEHQMDGVRVTLGQKERKREKELNCLQYGSMALQTAREKSHTFYKHSSKLGATSKVWMEECCGPQYPADVVFEFCNSWKRTEKLDWLFPLQNRCKSPSWTERLDPFCSLQNMAVGG